MLHNLQYLCYGKKVGRRLRPSVTSTLPKKYKFYFSHPSTILAINVQIGYQLVANSCSGRAWKTTPTFLPILRSFPSWRSRQLPLISMTGVCEAMLTWSTLELTFQNRDWLDNSRISYNGCIREFIGRFEEFRQSSTTLWACHQPCFQRRWECSQWKLFVRKGRQSLNETKTLFIKNRSRNYVAPTCRINQKNVRVYCLTRGTKKSTA